MRKKMFGYVLFCAILFFISWVLGMITKLSWIQNSDVRDQVKRGTNMIVSLQDEENFINAYFENEFEDLKELENKADYILEVEPLKRRINLSQSIVSDVNVKKVLKGDATTFESQNLRICEPSYFMYNELYYSLGGYNIMQEGKKYLLFLKCVRISDINHNRDATMMMPISTLYGKYEISDKETYMIDSDLLKNQQIFYSDIDNLEIISVSEKTRERFSTLKEAVLKKYGKNL